MAEKDSPLQSTDGPELRIPQTPGSVIRATVTSTYSGKTGRRTFLRRPGGEFYGGECPWVAHQDVGDMAYWRDEDFTDVEVIYDTNERRSE